MKIRMKMRERETFEEEERDDFRRERERDDFRRESGPILTGPPTPAEREARKRK